MAAEGRSREALRLERVPLLCLSVSRLCVLGVQAYIQAGVGNSDLVGVRTVGHVWLPITSQFHKKINVRIEY